MDAHRIHGALIWSVLAVGLLTGVGETAAEDPAPVPAEEALPASAAFVGELIIDELGVESGLRIRVFHDPSFFGVPPSAGHLFLVAADSALGDAAFFIPTDLAFELGTSQLYHVEFEQASDLFGQALGGILRPGEAQIGFVVLPPAVAVEEYLPGNPESMVIRYAHHRTAMRPATAGEISWWETAVSKQHLGSALNSWWEWIRVIEDAPEMTEGEQRYLTERLFPGQGHVISEEGMSAVGLRNAILRVGERRLLESRTIQRVAPQYPIAARQKGARGLVVALVYITAEGTVGDAMILASNTVHMLNLSALVASRDWRFRRAQNESGEYVDGWRILPFQYKLEEPVVEAAPDTTADTYKPPQILKRGELDYPFEARRQKIKGMVKYRITVDRRGKLVKVVLEQGVHPIVDQAALAAVERTRFLPALQDGEPVRGDVVMSFDFQEDLD
jgi:TonB family protein